MEMCCVSGTRQSDLGSIVEPGALAFASIQREEKSSRQRLTLGG
jgi:hypothetical protein